jgi:nitroimidazol reductase NimA-like FMN-containing flavoprotein (pyridoxamine 5'-phosphate oxidase superfamily)
VNDEAVRRQPTVRQQAGADAPESPGPRAMVELSRAEALDLLAGVRMGRIVFTRRALPAIRPVNHVPTDGRIVILTHEGAAITAASGGHGVVVAYEADQIDPGAQLGWSVVVTGLARPTTDPGQLARYRALPAPWVDREMSQVVLVSLEMVTGYRLTVRHNAPPAGSGEPIADTAPGS